jgi:hypothetical protein
MNFELRMVYDQYVAYYREFQVDFEQQLGQQISERFRSPLLSVEDFAVIWERWGEQGTQTSWRDRFAQGYARHAQEFAERIKSVLTRVNAVSNSIPLTDAA